MRGFALPALLLAGLTARQAVAGEPVAEPGPTLQQSPTAVVPPLLDPAAQVSFRALTTLDTTGLSFTSCAPTTPRPATPGSGTVVFELQLRRGHVSLVSVMSADDAAAPYQECLTRVLTDYAWPVRRGTLRVPVEVAPTPGATGGG